MFQLGSIESEEDMDFGDSSQSVRAVEAVKLMNGRWGG